MMIVQPMLVSSVRSGIAFFYSLLDEDAQYFNYPLHYRIRQEN